MTEQTYIEWLEQKIAECEGWISIGPINRQSEWEFKKRSFVAAKEKYEDLEIWVDVKNNLPADRPGWSHSEDVNICYMDGVVSTGAYSHRNNKWSDYLYTDRKYPTHWTTLPPPQSTN